MKEKLDINALSDEELRKLLSSLPYAEVMDFILSLPSEDGERIYEHITGQRYADDEKLSEDEMLHILFEDGA